MAKTLNSEEWLTRAADSMVRDIFEPAGYGENPATGEPLNERLRAQVGYPTAKALNRNGKAIGQCVPNAASAGGFTEVFISPVLGKGSPMRGGDNPKTVLMTLAHEIAHAAAGYAAGHGPHFAEVIKAINICSERYADNDPYAMADGSPRAGTLIDMHFAGSEVETISPEFDAYCDTLIGKLGEYDRFAITMETMPRASTKLLKCVCLNKDCPSQMPSGRSYTVRLTWHWAKQGTPFCGICNERMSVYLPRAKGQSGKGAGEKDPNAQPVAIGSGEGEGGEDDSRDDVPMHTDPDDEPSGGSDDDGEGDESDGGEQDGPPDDEIMGDGEGDEPPADEINSGPDEPSKEDNTPSPAGNNKKGGKGKVEAKGGKGESKSGPATRTTIDGPHKVSLKCDCDVCSNARKLAGLEV